MPLTLNFLYDEPWLLMLVASSLGAHEVGKIELINRKFRKAMLSNNRLWGALFYFHYISYKSTSLDETILRKIFRPFKGDAVGWNVSVMQSDDPSSGATGRIIDYRQNRFSEVEYLVTYDDESIPMKWEREHRGNGKSSYLGYWRFDFLMSPEDLTKKTKQLKDRAREFGEANASESEYNWRDEFHKHLKHCPTQFADTLKVHKDEVLWAEFSHCGRFLTCVSRDGSFSVMEVNSHGKILGSITKRTHSRMAGCYISWSPDDAFLFVRTEEPMGSGMAVGEVWSFLPPLRISSSTMAADGIDLAKFPHRLGKRTGTFAIPEDVSSIPIAYGMLEHRYSFDPIEPNYCFCLWRTRDMIPDCQLNDFPFSLCMPTGTGSTTQQIILSTALGYEYDHDRRWSTHHTQLFVAIDLCKLLRRTDFGSLAYSYQHLSQLGTVTADSNENGENEVTAPAYPPPVTAAVTAAATTTATSTTSAAISTGGLHSGDMIVHDDNNNDAVIATNEGETAAGSNNTNETLQSVEDLAVGGDDENDDGDGVGEEEEEEEEEEGANGLDFGTEVVPADIVGKFQLVFPVNNDEDVNIIDLNQNGNMADLLTIPSVPTQGKAMGRGPIYLADIFHGGSVAPTTTTTTTMTTTTAAASNESSILVGTSHIHHSSTNLNASSPGSVLSEPLSSTLEPSAGAEINNSLDPYSTNQDYLLYLIGTHVPHFNILCMLPLNEALPSGPSTATATTIQRFEYNNYPHIDLNGSAIGLHTSARGSDSPFIYLNIRPAVYQEAYSGKGVFCNVTGQCLQRPGELPDIKQEMEIRVYNYCGWNKSAAGATATGSPTSGFQCLYRFSGHYSFSLKLSPFFVACSMQTMSDESAHTHQMNPLGRTGDTTGSYVADDVEPLISKMPADGDQDAFTLIGPRNGKKLSYVLASGSENGDVHVWSLNHGTVTTLDNIVGKTGDNGGTSCDGTSVVPSDTRAAVNDCSGAKLPIQSLSRHTDHCGSVNFNSKVPGMLVTASDDFSINIYVNAISRAAGDGTHREHNDI